MRGALISIALALGAIACGGKTTPAGPNDPAGPGEVFDCCCFAGEGSVEPMERAACTELGGECLEDGERCGAAGGGDDAGGEGDPGEY